MSVTEEEMQNWHRRLGIANEKNAILGIRLENWATTSDFMPVVSISKGRRVITFKANSMHEPDYASASLIFGELTHCLRSVLDNLAYSLVVSANPEQVNNRNIFYPIYEQEAAYDANIALRLPDVSSDLLHIIRASQPFAQNDTSPHLDALSLLHRADIRDKHKTPPFCALIPNTFSYSFTGDTSRLNNSDGEIESIILPERVVPGKTIARLRFKKPFGTGFKVSTSIDLQFVINIGDEYHDIGALCSSFAVRVFSIVNTVTRHLRSEQGLTEKPPLSELPNRFTYY